MRTPIAAAIVFVVSAAVLMLEILAGRLLAPYVGVSLETYTAVIGTVLAGIAAGSWLGGWLADRLEPRRLLGPMIILGGGFALATVPIVRSFGDASAEQSSAATTVTLALLGFFLPAALLSAVTPTVVKLQLRDLGQTGGVVGRLSAFGTIGALVGTFVTGFLLVATAPTRAVIFSIGGVLVGIGFGLWLWLSRQDSAALLAVLLVPVATGAWAATADEPCEVESAYFCMRVEADPAREGGRILWLDNLRHSYVDLDDATYLGFGYTQNFADAIDASFPEGEPLDALHIGGGGFTMPRYLRTTRPDSQSRVLEIDPAVLDIGRDKLGLHTSKDLRVHIGDARVGIRGDPDNSYDLVIGDAFGGLSVPWHLTTREFVREVDRVLRPGGLYVVNVIDYPPFRFARAEVATLRKEFDFVAVIADPAAIQGEFGGNIVLVASDQPLDTAAMQARVEARVQDALTGTALDAFVADAPVITDDYAPVDQWLSTARP